LEPLEVVHDADEEEFVLFPERAGIKLPEFFIFLLQNDLDGFISGSIGKS